MITACLAWYDEPIELLARTVASLEGAADYLVALDGRYRDFPGELINSAPEQSNAIARASRTAGVDGVIVHAGDIWPDQVAKRNFLLELAPPETDWLLVIDADEYVDAQDREALDELLDATDADAGELGLTNLSNRWPHDQMRANTYTVRRLFRAACEPRYELAHNGVRAAGGAWLSGDRAHVAVAPAVDVSAALGLGHQIDARPLERHRARSVYYRARADQRLENWAAA